MTPEQQLLERIRRALAEAGVDTDGMVAQAYEEARAEVADVLRRLMVQDLLGRALHSLGGQPPTDERPPRGHAPPQDAAPQDAPEEDALTEDALEEAPREDRPPAATASTGHVAAATDGTMTYVFGITRADAAPDTAGLSPLPGGGAPRVLAADGVQAVVCDVDPTTFEALCTPGPDGLDILTAAALAHDAALAAIASQTTVLPLQLGTAVPDDAAVRDLLRDHGARLRAELDRLAGHAEWSVTVQVLDDGDRDGDDAARTASSGSDYLQRRGASLNRRASRFEQRERLARHLHERLAAVAAASDTVSSRPVDDVAPPLLHGVYLLTGDAVADLEDVVASLREEHPEAVIEIGGPWPPYHFSAVELAVPPGPGA